MKPMKKLIVDLDNTITRESEASYKDKPVNQDVVAKLVEYKAMGFSIVIFTARNMRTHEGNIGKINIYTLPTIINWLDEHNVPYDEIIVGKPWCGNEGFYVDDRAIRPSEFISKSFDELTSLLELEKV